MRFAIASALLVLVALVTRTPLPVRRWRPVTAAAAFGFLGFNGLAFLGLRLTPTSDSALIVPTTIPVATALFATLIHEQLTSRKLLGFAVASVGAAVVIAGGQQICGGIFRTPPPPAPPPPRHAPSSGALPSRTAPPVPRTRGPGVWPPVSLPGEGEFF